jgi:hypothetical protein
LCSSQLVIHVWLYQKRIKYSIYGNYFTFTEWFWLLEQRNILRWKAFFPPYAIVMFVAVGIMWWPGNMHMQFCKIVHTHNTSRYIETISDNHSLLALWISKRNIPVKFDLLRSNSPVLGAWLFFQGKDSKEFRTPTGYLTQPNPSGLTRPLGFTHPLTEMSTRNIKITIFLGSKVRQSMSRLSRQCGILNISQPYRPPRPVTGIALPLKVSGNYLDARFHIQKHCVWLTKRIFVFRMSL